MNVTDKVKYLAFTFLVILGCFYRLSGQEFSGPAISRFGGVASLSLNPALLTQSAFYLDVNVVSANGFADNSMFYLPPSYRAFSKLIRRDYNLYEGPYKYDRSYNYFNNTNRKYFEVSARVMGPSAMIQFGRHALALSTAFRNLQSGKNIPWEIPVILYEEISHKPLQQIEFNDQEIRMGALSWFETGLSYAYNAVENRNYLLSLGASVKYLMGVEGVYIYGKNLNYIITDSKTVNIINLDAETGFSVPLDLNTDQPDFEPFIRGTGWSADFGLVFTRLEERFNYYAEDRICARPFREYQFKIGVSLLDLGSITFKNDAETHRFENVSHNWQNFDTIRLVSVNQMLGMLNTVFSGQPDASFVDSKVSIRMPARVNLIFDYHMLKNYYLGLSFTQPITSGANSLWYPSRIKVVPRIENENFGFMLPVTLYNYQKILLGTAVRFYFFTIGTENLISFFDVKDFTGTSIYFSVKFSLLKGKCLSTTKGACYNTRFKY